MRVAALQMAMSPEVASNVATAERLVRAAAASGANVILIPELFEGATLVFVFGLPVSVWWALASVGTNGFPNQHAAWHCSVLM